MSTITLRRLQTELASRLDRLDAKAALLEQHAQRFGHPHPAPERRSFLQPAIGTTLRTARRAKRALAGVVDRLEGVRGDPRIAFALRISWGGLHDAAICLSLACALLLASALALALVAPPF
jgi:hypothetical protein